MIPTEPVRFFEYFDLITLVILFFIINSLLYSHYQRTGGFLRSVSHTLATPKRGHLIYSVAMTLLFPFYYACIYFWVGPRYQSPSILYYILIISAICEMVFVWVPHNSRRNGFIHDATPGVVGLAMLSLPTILLVTGKNIGMVAGVSTVIFLVAALVMTSLMLFKKFRVDHFTFYFEYLFLTTFFVVISLLAHT